MAERLWYCTGRDRSFLFERFQSRVDGGHSAGNLLVPHAAIHGDFRVSLRSFTSAVAWGIGEKKWLRLMVPYVSISGLVWIAKWIAEQVHFSLQYPVKREDLWAFLLYPQYGFACFLWFVYTLFLIFCFVRVLEMARMPLWLLFLVALGLSLCPLPREFCLSLVGANLVYFVFGMGLKRLLEMNFFEERWKDGAMAVGSLVLFFCFGVDDAGQWNAGNPVAANNCISRNILLLVSCTACGWPGKPIPHGLAGRVVFRYLFAAHPLHGGHSLCMGTMAGCPFVLFASSAFIRLGVFLADDSRRDAARGACPIPVGMQDFSWNVPPAVQ